MSDSSRPHGLQPTRLLHPWDFQARVLEWGAIAFSVSHIRMPLKNTSWNYIHKQLFNERTNEQLLYGKRKRKRYPGSSGRKQGL